MKLLPSTIVAGVLATATLVAQVPPQAPQRGDNPAARGTAPGRGAALPPLSPASIERAQAILADTRKAMGGEKLDAVKTLVASGRTRRVRGNNLVPIEFEINIELPDKYVRKDEVPAEESEPTSTGFVGTQIIQFPLAPAGRGGPGPAPGAPGRGPAPTPTPEQLEAQRLARLTTVKQDFARLMLGLFASSLDAYPMTFGYASQAAAPQGTADVLEVRGAGNFAVRLFIASDTKLPIMITWQAPPTAVVVLTPGQPPPATVAPGAVVVQGPAAPPADASQETRDQYARAVTELRQRSQATPVEYRIYYAEYRDVNGVKLPFRLRRAIGVDTTEETTFDRFRINASIDQKKFAASK
jgi:hypothetical protein